MRALCIVALLTVGAASPAPPTAFDLQKADTTSAAEGDRHKFEQILARREFGAARRDAGLPDLKVEADSTWLRALIDTLREPVEKVLEWFREWWNRGRFTPPEAGSWVSRAAGPLTWIVVALALALLALVLRRVALHRRGRPEAISGSAVVAAAGNVVPDALSQSADVWALCAEQFARDGRWHLALRALYLELLVVLHERGAVRYERERTNGDYVRLLRETPASPAFSRLTAAFDEAWYGNKPFTPAAYEAALACVREVDRVTTRPTGIGA